jgi:flagella basal body P-ring formation protein FlgA
MTVICLAQQLPPQESLERLTKIAEDVLRQRLAQSAPDAEVHILPLDSRLRLPACPRVDGFLPRSDNLLGMVTIGLSCPGPQPWQIFATAQVRLIRPVVTAQRSLARGDKITPQDLQLTPEDISQTPSGTFADPKPLLGRTVRRPLTPSSIVTERDLEPDFAVSRGQRIEMMASIGHGFVTADGQALQDGRLGETIRARNLRSKKVVQGVVSGPGQIRITP